MTECVAVGKRLPNQGIAFLTTPSSLPGREFEAALGGPTFCHEDIGDRFGDAQSLEKYIIAVKYALQTFKWVAFPL